MSKTPNELLVLEALKWVGLHETAGKGINKHIDRFYAESGTPWVQDDSTPWCSAFMCYLMTATGLYNPFTLRARNWESIPEKSAEHLTAAELTTGDVVVLKRGSRWSRKGHVGVYMGSTGRYVWVLGGNQDDSVSFKKYPLRKVICGKRMKTVPTVEWC